MDRTGTCDLCGQPLGEASSAPVAGLILCSPCHHGDFWGRLAERGLRLQCLARADYPSGGHSSSVHRSVAGAIPYDLGISGHFSKEDLFSKIGKWFSAELEVGDAGFDEALYIRSDDPEALAEALGGEGLRAAILHAVQATDSPLVIEGGRLSFDALSLSVSEVPVTLRALALVLHQLERLAVERGTPRRPEFAEYPDVRRILEHVETCATLGDKRYWPKGLFLQAATLDTLSTVARIHEVMDERSSRPMRMFRLIHSHLISEDLAPLASMKRLRVLELDPY